MPPTLSRRGTPTDCRLVEPVLPCSHGCIRKGWPSLDIKQYLTILWRWAWLIVLCTAIAGTGAFLVTSSQPRIYAAKTTVLANAAGAAPQVTDTNLRTAERMLGTYAELMVSRPVLDQVITNLGLNTSPAALAGQILVEVTPNTLLISLTVEDEDPERAAAIANEIPRVLNTLEQDLLGNPYLSGYSEPLNVVEVALPRFTPVTPNVSSAVALAMLAALVLSAGVALLIEYLDDTVKTSVDVGRVTGLPTLAAIRRIRGGDHAGRLVVANTPRSPIAETYRMFLAHLAYSSAERPIKTLLVASAEAGEGKSTNVANLGVALAQTGKRVIVVDMDLRSPTLHRFFKRTNQLGVTSALQRPAGESLVDGHHLVSTGIENLMLMPSGPLPPNPARLFGSPQMAELVAELEREADVVIFDSPSVLAVVDATLLARTCDAAILVARAKATRSDALRQAHTQIAQAGTFIIGVLLNNVTSGRAITYYASDRRGPFGVFGGTDVAYASKTPGGKPPAKKE